MAGYFKLLNLDLNFTPLSLLRPLNAYPHPLVKFFSSLFEPHIALFSVYGEPESAGAVLVGVELQDDIVGP